MQFVVEYLVIIDKATNKALYHLCDSTKDFDKLLESDIDIKISSKQIEFKNSLKCRYDNSSGQVQGKTQRFFQIKITFDEDVTRVNEFLLLLRSVRESLHNAGTPPESLWDDVSLFYSQQAYPLVHKTENVMRKLITYFMFTRIGKQWVTENLPNTIKDAVEKSKRKQYLDILYQVDFIHLGDFLFKKYPAKKLIDELLAQLNEVQTTDELDLQELKEFVPKSNWERYFSEIVECNDQYLRTKWDKLYKLRCKVAHNAIVTKDEFEQIEDLSIDIIAKLQKAIDNLDKVHVPEEDREEVAENVASNISTLYGEFIQEWKRFESTVQQISDYFSDDDGKRRGIMPHQLVNQLQQNGFISDELTNKTKELSIFRNNLVHDPNLDVNEQNIQHYISQLQGATIEFQQLATVKSSWRDEIVSTLKALGGEVSLSELYEYIETNTTRNLTETWKSTVRYTLQINSSSSKSFRTGKDVFVHLEKGLWALRDNSGESGPS